MLSISLHKYFKYFWCLNFVLWFFAGNVLLQKVKKSLPFCGLLESSNKFIFVSTLDGKITALNPDKQGSVVWSVQLGTESMLSCNIHKLELTNYGHLVRMIPSLSGGLYKFNGESIEAIPVTVEHLLQASFKYSDDLVISGGKESQTFGVALQSGKILYECSMKGCENSSKFNNVGDILVIQRLGQTIRAIEPRTGSERWNFSVAQHDLKLLSDCHDHQPTEQNFKLSVIVPEGLICAMDISDRNKIIWQHRFDAPITGAWQIHKGKLFMIDLFSSFQPQNLDMVMSPTLYVGMHDKQLYIQESVLMQKKRQEISNKIGQNLISNDNNELSIPWKPIAASHNVAGLIEGKLHKKEDVLDEITQRQTTALSVLYASSYVEGNGFYLYPEERPIELEENINYITVNKEDDQRKSDNQDYKNIEEDTSVQIVIVSLWYWWKEVVVISFTTAILFNIMFTRRFLFRQSKNLQFDVDETKSSAKVKNSDSGIDVNIEKINDGTESRPNQEYVSRYLTDFEPVTCLGRGGFGVVFEAKNKIDECHYAIKRIVLPISQESRDRVMREVKALAKLDHHHIVRYFNAWTECPPPGWQENFDKLWIDSLDLSSGMEINSDHTTNKLKPLSTNSPSNFDFSSHCSQNKNFHYKNDRLNSPLETNKTNDSFIVFEERSENDSDNDEFEAMNVKDSVVVVSSDSEEFDNENNHNFSKTNFQNSTFSEKRKRCALSCNRVYLYIQMQLCQKQSLKDWLALNADRDYNYVVKIFEQILQAVEHVHLQGLIHRDLKPSNIFFSLDNEIKVGDFGLVTTMTEGEQLVAPCECAKVDSKKERHTAQVGTQLYMSPEQLAGKHYNYKVDIYSLGLILFELLVPFKTQMERIHVLEDVKKDIFSEDFRKNYKKEYDLLRLMLSYSPDERPTTYGIRARLSLKQEINEESWHFDLPKRRRGSSKTSSTSSSESSFE